MSLKIYNTLSRKKETFKPLEEGKVSMYVCGMTVYDYCHLGHARVLVAFDIINRYLQAKGYNTELYPDGEAGFRAFSKGKYDLCVLDVMMPKKDGFTLARDIRQINDEVPFIFLTAKTLKEDIFEGFRVGADDYLTKPFSMEELKIGRAHV